MKHISIDDVDIELPFEAQDYITMHKKRLASGHFVVAYAAHDEGAENPIESCDGMGKIIEHHRQSHADETSQMLQDNPLIVPLSKFEHGSVIWGVMGSLSGTPDFRWDGTSYAGRWEPDSSCIEHIRFEAKKGIKTERELAIECAAQACKVYTAWCNGGSYGWVCAWFDKDGNEIDHDSVWGYCDGDTKYLEEEILSNFESKCEELEKISVETQLAECVP